MPEPPFPREANDRLPYISGEAYELEKLGDIAMREAKWYAPCRMWGIDLTERFKSSRLPMDPANCFIWFGSVREAIAMRDYALKHHRDNVNKMIRGW